MENISGIILPQRNANERKELQTENIRHDKRQFHLFKQLAHLRAYFRTFPSRLQTSRFFPCTLYDSIAQITQITRKIQIAQNESCNIKPNRDKKS